jgi:hypothetical protein
MGAQHQFLKTITKVVMEKCLEFISLQVSGPQQGVRENKKCSANLLPKSTKK